MKKLVLILFLLCIQTVCCSQISKKPVENIYLKTNKYEGVIFPKNHLELVGGNKNWTPNEKDIGKAEIILNESRILVENKGLNRLQGCPVIYKNLKKYKRQYFGYHNQKGEKVIWINFIHIKSIFLDGWHERLISVNDGCTYYWSIEINLDKGICEKLWINGFG